MEFSVPLVLIVEDHQDTRDLYTVGKETARRLGCTSSLFKPFRPEVLANEIHRVIAPQQAVKTAAGRRRREAVPRLWRHNEIQPSLSGLDPSRGIILGRIVKE
jgi:hypothetical protein